MRPTRDSHRTTARSSRSIWGRFPLRALRGDLAGGEPSDGLVGLARELAHGGAVPAEEFLPDQRGAAVALVGLAAGKPASPMTAPGGAAGKGILNPRATRLGPVIALFAVLDQVQTDGLHFFVHAQADDDSHQ